MRFSIKLLFLAFLFSDFAFSQIQVQLNPKVIVRGTQADFTIIAYGNSIHIENIQELGGFPILGISTESFYNNINGKMSQGKKFHYHFSPDKNISIQPITLEIDGNIEKTALTKVTVVEPSFNEKDPFKIKISTEKTDYYLGETIKVQVEYSEKLSQEVVERRYSEPAGKNLWLKHKSQAKDRQSATNYLIDFTYFFTPQQIGEVEIQSAKMRIGTRAKQRDSWGFFFESAKWHNIVSNSLKLNIINSPSKYVGDFNISAEADKTEIKSGEAVNVTLKIIGNGNIEDFEPLKISLNNGIIYDEKPNIEKNVDSENNYLAVFTQKFAVILDKNESIPAFKIEFFNPKTNQIVTKRSREIPITVLPTKNISTNQELNVIRAVQNEKPQNDSVNYIYVIVAFFSGVLLTLLIIFLPLTKFKILNRIRNLINRDRDILKKLLPEIHTDKKILDIANKLESRIYHKTKIKIPKKDLKEVLLLINSKI